MKLLFVTSNRIGDAVLSTGILGHLVDQHPGLAVTVACGPESAPLFEEVPGLDRLIPLPKQTWKRHWLGLWAGCVGTYWDLVVDIRRSIIGWSVLHRRSMTVPRDSRNLHRVRLLGSMLGLGDAPPAPRLWTGPANRARAAETIPDKGALALGPTANWRGKIWPADHFVDLAKRLTGAGGPLEGQPVAVFAAPHEARDVKEVVEGLRDRTVIDLTGRTGLLDAAACLARCNLYLGNDSGLMHLAAAAGTPTLGLFGPSRPELYAPWGDKTAVVRTEESYESLMARTGPDGAVRDTLMRGLTVSRTAAAAGALLHRIAEAGEPNAHAG